jgi:hypothetical protein
MKKTRRAWKGWAVVTKDGGEVRYVTGDRKYKPVLPMASAGLKRVKVEIKEVR